MIYQQQYLRSWPSFPSHFQCTRSSASSSWGCPKNQNGKSCFSLSPSYQTYPQLSFTQERSPPESPLLHSSHSSPSASTLMDESSTSFLAFFRVSRDYGQYQCWDSSVPASFYAAKSPFSAFKLYQQLMVSGQFGTEINSKECSSRGHICLPTICLHMLSPRRKSQPVGVRLRSFQKLIGECAFRSNDRLFVTDTVNFALQFFDLCLLQKPFVKLVCLEDHGIEVLNNLLLSFLLVLIVLRESLKEGGIFLLLLLKKQFLELPIKDIFLEQERLLKRTLFVSELIHLRGSTLFILLGIQLEKLTNRAEQIINFLKEILHVKMKGLHILRLIALILWNCLLLGVVGLLFRCQLSNLHLQEIVLSLQVFYLQQKQILLIDIAAHQLRITA